MLELKVTVPQEHIEADGARRYLSQAMAAIGFEPASPTLRQVGEAAYAAGFKVEVDLGTANGEADIYAAGAAKIMADVAAAPKRERGKPSPGRARRTKEEIAEDEAADAADAAQANISTGEARVDPANPEPEDSAEDQAQDAIDEAEEVEASRDPVKPLTNDDLKAEMTAYVQRFGIPAVQEDGAKIFRAGLGEPPAGETAWRLSLVGDDQERLVKAVAAWKAALAENPFKRASVAK